MENEYQVVGLMFEDRFYSTPDNPRFYGKIYEYKTKSNCIFEKYLSIALLKAGSIIMVERPFSIILVF